MENNNSHTFISEKMTLKNIDRTTYYLGEQKGFDREVLIYSFKLFFSDPENLLDYFEYEIKKLSKIEHPIIPSVIDISKKEKEIWITFKKPEGNTLEDIYLKGNALSNEQIWMIARSLSDCLSQMHKSEFILGGIKESSLYYENNRWLRFNPDTFIEKIYRDIEKSLSGLRDEELTDDINRDISSFGRFIACLFIGDQNFRILTKMRDTSFKIKKEYINIIESNSNITPEQNKLISEIISVEINNFEQIKNRINNIL